MSRITQFFLVFIMIFHTSELAATGNCAAPHALKFYFAFLLNSIIELIIEDFTLYVHFQGNTMLIQTALIQEINHSWFSVCFLIIRQLLVKRLRLKLKNVLQSNVLKLPSITPCQLSRCKNYLEFLEDVLKHLTSIVKQLHYR